MTDDTSPWYNIFERITLGPLAPADALHLIRNYNNNPYRYTAAAEQSILKYGEYKPFDTQWLCSEAVRAMLANNQTTVTEADVQQAVDAVIRVRAAEYAVINARVSEGGSVLFQEWTRRTQA